MRENVIRLALTLGAGVVVFGAVTFAEWARERGPFAAFYERPAELRAKLEPGTTLGESVVGAAGREVGGFFLTGPSRPGEHCWHERLVDFGGGIGCCYCGARKWIEHVSATPSGHGAFGPRTLRRVERSSPEEIAAVCTGRAATKGAGR